MGGKRIDDRSFWAGKGSKGSVFPEGVKVKEIAESQGCGELKMYEDTQEAIHTAQNMADKKVKSHPQPPYHRN